MKLTKETLKRIINEELEATLSEMRKPVVYAKKLTPQLFARHAGTHAARTAGIKNQEQLKKHAQDFSNKILKLLKDLNEYGEVFIDSPFGGRDVVLKPMGNETAEFLEDQFMDYFFDNMPDDFESPEDETSEPSAQDQLEAEKDIFDFFGEEK